MCTLMVICIMVSYLYSYEKIGTSLNIPYVKIQETSSLFLKEGEQILIASPGGGDCEKLKKGIEVWCRGRSSEKKGGGGLALSYVIFSRFIIFTFQMLSISISEY